MIIRKLQKERLKLRTLIFLVLLIILAIRGIFKIFHFPTQDDIDINLVPAVPGYEQDETVIISGIILSENHFPVYTHVVQTQDEKKFGIKSSSLNLNNYSWQIEIVGTVDTIIKTLPVIDVTTIKIPDKNLIITNNNYFFVDALLQFDFSNQIGFRAVKSWEIIEIYFNDLRLLYIERFACNKVTKNQNCDNIVNDLRYAAAEHFSSYLENDFYRYKSGSRIAFNKDIFAYIFTPINDETILDIANIISIIDFKNITTKKRDEINQNCKNEKEKLTNIWLVQMTHDDPKQVIFLIKGVTNSWNQASCTMIFDIWNNWITRNIMFDIDDS